MRASPRLRTVPVTLLVLLATTATATTATAAATHHHPSAATLRLRHAARHAILDCVSNDRIDARWSSRVLAEALRTLPTDMAEYTPCPAVLRHARLHALTRERHAAARHKHRHGHR